jgi:hypothetical protein
MYCSKPSNALQQAINQTSAGHQMYFLMVALTLSPAFSALAAAATACTRNTMATPQQGILCLQGSQPGMLLEYWVHSILLPVAN